jgi:type II secretory ATPase GspE/PulE/Tfp pilus assembly ATPase PilB-like protein
MADNRRTMSQTEFRLKLGSRNILQALLRSLVQKKPLTEEDADAVLGVTIRKVSDTLHAQAVTIFMVDTANQCLLFKRVYYSPSLYGDDAGKQTAFEEKARELERMMLPLGHGIVGHVVSTGKAEFIADVKRDRRHLATVDKDTGFVTSSMIAVPLKVGDEVVGCIQALNKAEDGVTVTQFAQEDVALLEEVADYSARIIQRIRDPGTPLSEKEVAAYLAKLAGCEFVEIDKNTEMDAALMAEFDGESLKQINILPLARLDDKKIRAACANPIDIQTLTDFEIKTGFKIQEKAVATAANIQEALQRAYPEKAAMHEVAEAVEVEFAARTEDLEKSESDDENSAPIVRLSNRIIEDAYSKGASDIHIEPAETGTTVRFRVDGICKVQMEIPRTAHRALISRLNIMSDLDISERRLPQDGRIQFKKFNPKFDLDLRVSTAPMNFGEKVCMRILDKTKSCLPLDKLGFSEYNMTMYRDLITAPYGMVLHCGPTGSGKSMTLFAALNEIKSPEINISTAEDPIEYTLPGINQMQMKKEIDLTFANAIRCFLRQDPDVLLVGEIRDLETAEAAIEAALTGHLLFSTLHTNDAPTTISRFDEMGVEPFMVSTCLVAICAQRLLRRLCSCKKEDDPTPDERKMLERALDEKPVGRIMRPGGCDRCEESGYKGRTGTHELLRNSDELRVLINSKSTVDKLKTAARAAGMRTLFEDLMEKVKLGITSLPEAIGTARPDDTPSPLKSSRPGAAPPAPAAAHVPVAAPPVAPGKGKAWEDVFKKKT